MSKSPENERASAAYLCTHLLKVRRDLLTEGAYTPSHDRHLRELAGVTLWKHSEADGKIQGCRFWSHEALAAQKRRQSKELQHEHVFPKKQMIELLFDLDSPDLATVRRLLDELNIAAVVTKTEHRRLGGIPGTRHDVWERYRTAGIPWVDQTAQ
ncbi:hypothetical protein F2Q65_12960 [Thiohalocapsa marina]|uniref:Uncharacterized protein n=1 Tax=Thiohalocapsa marina TaxID=424902 RepID=A0A5M8FJR2_9GAMM|nr:hypothetical protein [Thiohalocapsa marina]KAA6184220.1 hypothetical protein F2Q65_12960 [Thiohalocapsa marina]